ncbi:MAG: helix-turn-helix transcriptional regulator [Clostridia bacterium]|nr:helix-turn-helix transcriptional regulator [Clostridia bacterium]
MFNVLTDLIITKVYSANTMYTVGNNNKKTKKTNRSNWGMIIKYEGETIYKSQKNTYISNADCIILLPKGAYYEWFCTKSGHFTIIEFESSAEFDEPISYDISGNNEIFKLFKTLENIMLVKNPQYNLESLQTIYLILLKAIKSNHANSNYVPNNKKIQIEPAIKYILDNYSKNIRNDYLASLCHMSTVYFRKLFTEIYGIPPINYIHHLKIKKAKEILKSDYTSISDIASYLGYNNVYEFSKDFKKHTGISPTKF